MSNHPFMAWLAANNLRQIDAAKAVGCSKSHLSLVLDGKRGASLRLAKELSDYTGGAVEMEDFIPRGATQ